MRKLTDKFRKDISLKTTRSKVLEYLRMSIDYRQKGKMKFSMKE